jgi:MFS family permease
MTRRNIPRPTTSSISLSWTHLHLLLGRLLEVSSGLNSVCLHEPGKFYVTTNHKCAAIFANVFLAGFDGTITASTYAIISSEFNAANTASWLTTSYLITSTAFQPLYGRFSDIFGRRICFFTSTITFAIGCLGCAVARDVVVLNLMRALTGLGGGGLLTMGKSQ